MSLTKPKSFPYSLKKQGMKESCRLAPNGSVFHKGIHLRKVNTTRNSEGICLAYFKCPNMKTPQKVENICGFSGRILNFPHALEIEILSGHNSKCSCVIKEKERINENYKNNFGNIFIDKGNEKKENVSDFPQRQYEIKSSIQGQILNKKRARSSSKEYPDKDYNHDNLMIKKRAEQRNRHKIQSLPLNSQDLYLNSFKDQSLPQKKEKDGKSIYEEYFNLVLNI